MSRPTRWLLGVGIALVALALAPCAAGGPGAHRHGPTAASPSPFDAGMRASMATMMRDMEAAPASSDPDKDFLAMMIPHHEGAVEMARLVLLHGRDPLVRRLAEEIIAGQQAEIEAMQGRLAILRKGSDSDPGGFPALHGTRGPVPNDPRPAPGSEGRPK